MMPFLEAYRLEAAIEPTDSNPMGPDAWQPHFNHYALWITSLASRQGVPLYFSIDRRVRLEPTRELVFGYMAQTLYAWSQGFEYFQHWCDQLSPYDARFYFDAVERSIGEFVRLLGQDALDEFIELGGPHL